MKVGGGVGGGVCVCGGGGEDLYRSFHIFISRLLI